MLRRALPLWAALAILALGFTSPVAAQTQLGAIQGTITDQSAGVLPGVTVTVTQVETGVSRSTVSNETGVYRIQSLDTGRYRITG